MAKSSYDYSGSFLCVHQIHHAFNPQESNHNAPKRKFDTNRNTRRTIILTFRFHYGKTRKPVMFMISGFLDVSMTPRTTQVHLWRHQDTSKKPRNPKSVLKNIILGNLIGKDGHRKVMKICLKNYWKSWLWDQYIPGRWNVYWKPWIWMKWKCGNTRSISSKKTWMDISWCGINVFQTHEMVVESLKRRNE